MIYYLDGSKMTDRIVAHDHLIQALSLPDWYGRNLDALFDLLTDMGPETEIILRSPKQVLQNLGRYGEAMLETLREAAEQNPNLTVNLQ